MGSISRSFGQTPLLGDHFRSKFRRPSESLYGLKSKLGLETVLSENYRENTGFQDHKRISKWTILVHPVRINILLSKKSTFQDAFFLKKYIFNKISVYVFTGIIMALNRLYQGSKVPRRAEGQAFLENIDGNLARFGLLIPDLHQIQNFGNNLC